MFENAKVGDRVWDFRHKWGTIIAITPNTKYPLYVKYDNPNIYSTNYSIDGKLFLDDTNPSLFWDEIKFKMPEKPFDLEYELKKLEITEFKVAERNCFLIWDSAFKKINYDVVGNNEQPNIKYFTEESINRFLNSIKDKKITKEQFFEAYRTLFI